MYMYIFIYITAKIDTCGNNFRGPTEECDNGDRVGCTNVIVIDYFYYFFNITLWC